MIKHYCDIKDCGKEVKEFLGKEVQIILFEPSIALDVVLEVKETSFIGNIDLCPECKNKLFSGRGIQSVNGSLSFAPIDKMIK